LPDGASVLIRSIRPDDKQRLLDAFLRLSPLSVQYRFLQSKGTLTETELSYYTELDFDNHVGLVATVGSGDPEEIVCVGRYVVIDPGEPIPRADSGIAVIDEFQHRGIGRPMMMALARIARGRDVSMFEADVSGDNRHFIESLGHCGYQLQSTLDSNTIHLSFSALDSNVVQGRTKMPNQGPHGTQ